MTPQAKRRWSAGLGRVSARQVMLALAVLVTFAGLSLFAFSVVSAAIVAPGSCFSRMSSFVPSIFVFALRGTRPHDDRIVIVGIDERTFRSGIVPLPRKS